MNKPAACKVCLGALVLVGTGAATLRADQQAELVSINYPEQLEALVDYFSPSTWLPPCPRTVSAFR